MSSKTLSISDILTIDDSTKPTDDVNDSSQHDSSTVSETPKLSDNTKLSERPKAIKSPKPSTNSKSSKSSKARKSSKASEALSDDQPESDSESESMPETKEKSKLHVLLGAKVWSAHTVPLKVKGDYSTCMITGCGFLPNGYAVLCDHSNDGIKLLDEKLRIKGAAYLGGPHDVAVVNEYKVIVSLPLEARLQYIMIQSLTLDRSIDVGFYCYGVDVAHGLIFIVCHCGSTYTADGQVQVYGLADNLRKRIGSNWEGSWSFIKPYSIAISRCGTKLFVTDLGTHVISCVGIKGDVIY